MSYCLFRRLNYNLMNNIMIKQQFKQYSNQILRQIKILNINNNYDLRQNLKNEFNTKRTISTTTKINLFNLNDLISIQKRFKKMKKGSKQRKEESSDEESDEEMSAIAEEDPDFIDGKAIGFIDSNTTVTSLRLDTIAKVGLGIPRAKADEAFYGNLLRVNGERPSKKSLELTENDELDLIRGLNADNPDMIDVTRVAIKQIEDKMSSAGRIKIKLRRFLRLTIPNYSNDPYDGLSISTTRGEKEE